MKSNMQTIQHRWITKNPNTINFKVMHYRIFGSLLTVMFLRRWNLVVSKQVLCWNSPSSDSRQGLDQTSHRSGSKQVLYLSSLGPDSTQAMQLFSLVPDSRQGLCRIPLTCCSDSGSLFCCSISLMFFQQNYSISMKLKN